METSRLLGSPHRDRSNRPKRPPLLSVPSKFSFRSTISLEPALEHHELGPHEACELHINQNYRRPLDRLAYLAYYFPMLRWLPSYKPRDALGDFVAGLSLASFQVPLMMSFSTSLAKLPPLVGLYSVVAASLVYAVFGGVPTLIVGPLPSTAVLYGQAIHALQNGGFDLLSVQVSAILSAATGGILLAAGLLRYGFLDRVLSRALLKGFIGAMGVIMIVNQLAIQLGLQDLAGKYPSHTIVEKVRFAALHVSQAHRPTVLVSLVTLAAVLMLRRVKSLMVSRGVTLAVYIPELLAMVVVATILSYRYDWEARGIAIVGDLQPPKSPSSGEPSLLVNPFNPATVPLLKKAFSTSLLCLILGFFDSTTASKALSSKYNYTISSNRELIALGAVNLAVSLVGGMPSFGALGRSKINILAGAVSPLSSVFMAGAIVLAIYYLLPFLYYLPECTLSLSTTIIGITVIEEVPQDAGFFWRIGGYDEMAVLGAVFAATLFWSVETGVVLGILIAVMRLMRSGTRSHIHVLGRISNTSAFRNADELIEESFFEADSADSGTSRAECSPGRPAVAEMEHIDGVLIVRIPEPLSFANIGDLRRRLARIDKFHSLLVHPSQPGLDPGLATRYVIFDCKGMTSLDASATQELYEIVKRYTLHLRVAFSRVPTDQGVRQMLKRLGIRAMVNATMQDGPRAVPSSSGLGHGFFLSIDEALSRLPEDA